MDHEEYEKKQRAMHRRDNLRKALTYLFLSVWTVVVLFPFYWMVLTSLKSYAAYNAEHTPVFFTLEPTLENYQNADGTVTVPEALVKYMGTDIIK